MTKKESGKNSKLNKKREQETLTNAKIKKRMEKIGFLVKTTKIEDKTDKLEKNKINQQRLTSIRKFLLYVFCAVNTARIFSIGNTKKV